MRKLAILAFIVTPISGAIAAIPMTAAAAETHSNCAVFDNSGNIISVTRNCTQTMQQKGGNTGPPSPATNPCTGDPGLLAMSITHSVFHINVNGAGDLWITGTTNGGTSFVPDDSTKPSGTGNWTAWFGGSLNKYSSVQHDTFHLDIHFTNGQTATFHMVDHSSITPGGITNNFTKVDQSCN